MSEAIETTTQYPAWQQAIRQAQAEQQEIDAQYQAEQQAKQDKETAAEIADWTAKFNRVLAYLGLPQEAQGRVAVLGEIELSLDLFNTHSDGDWMFGVEIHPAKYPETEAELVTDDYDGSFRWWYHLPEVTVGTDGWRSPEKPDRQRMIRAALASGIDKMATAFEAAKAEHLRWQQQRKELIALNVELPLQKAPTLEEKLTGVLRELVREVLDERDMANGEY